MQSGSPFGRLAFLFGTGAVSDRLFALSVRRMSCLLLLLSGAMIAVSDRLIRFVLICAPVSCFLPSGVSGGFRTCLKTELFCATRLFVRTRGPRSPFPVMAYVPSVAPCRPFRSVPGCENRVAARRPGSERDRFESTADSESSLFSVRSMRIRPLRSPSCGGSLRCRGCRCFLRACGALRVWGGRFPAAPAFRSADRLRGRERPRGSAD